MKRFKSCATILAALTISASAAFAFGCTKADGKTHLPGNINGIDGEVNYYEDDTVDYEGRFEYSGAVEELGLGCSYNAAKLPYYGYGELQVNNNNVFDEAFRANEIAGVQKYKILSSKISSDYVSNIDEMAEGVCLNDDGCTEASGITRTYARRRFIYNDNSVRYYKYRYSCSLVLSSIRETYALSFEYFLNRLSEFKDNLSDEYLNALEAVFDGSMTYTQLFDKYGTHLVMSGIYGGTLAMHYSAASNIDEFRERASDIYLMLNSYVGGSPYESPTNPPVISNLLNCNSGKVKERNYCYIRGGDDVAFSTIIDFYDRYQEWVSSIDDNPALISVTSDGLRPLWEFLPDKYQNRLGEFQQALNDYVAENIVK